MKKWKCCLTAIVIAAGSMLVGCQESSSAKPIEAMYIPAGEDGHLMVGEGTGNVFTVTMPDNIQDKNGKKISEEDLNRGDIVAIYGDEIMLESYPGQYPGVTKIKVVKEGKASDADQYQDILDEFWPEKDPGELPYLNIGYRASYGEVSAAATRGGYSWSYLQKFFGYSRLYIEFVPVCSILWGGQIQMTCQVGHLHFFQSSIPHSITSVSEM